MSKLSRAFLLASLLFLMPVEITAQVYLSEDFSQISWYTQWNNTDYSATNPMAYGWEQNMLGNIANGCAAVRFTQSNGLSAARLKSPAFAIPSNKDLELSFYIKNDVPFNVYVSTDGGATYPASQCVFTNSGTNTNFTQYFVLLSTYKGSTVNLVFEATRPLIMSNTARNAYIDDIIVRALPSCQYPENPFVAGLTSTSADIQWSLNTRSGSVPDFYQIRLFDESGVMVQSADSLTFPQGLYYTYNGLTANTTYLASIKSYCSADGYSDSATVSFITLPNAINPPFAEDFNQMTSFPKGYYLTNCIINSVASYSHGNSGRSVKLSTTATDGAMIVFPLLNISSDDMDIAFSIRRGVNETSSVGVISFNAGYITDPMNIATFDPVYQGQLTGDVSWHEVHFNTSSVQYLAQPVMPCIMINAGYTTQVYLDDIVVRNIPSCIRPENIKVSSILDSTAVLSWNTSTATDYNIYLTNLADSSLTIIPASQSPTLLTNLSPNTNYSVSVRAICSAVDSSEMSSAAIFTTLCPVATSPVFAENFDQIVANQVPACWQMGWTVRTIGTLFVNTPFSTSSTNTHNNSAKAMSLVSQNDSSESYMVSRALNFDVAGKYDLSLWVYRQNASSKTVQGLQLWLTDSPYDTPGGLMLDYIHHHYSYSPAEFAQGWYQYIYNIPVQGIKYLMIRGISEQSTATYFDDLEIMVAPTCRRVKDIVMDSVTTSSANLHWTGVNGESQWAVTYTVISGTQPLVVDTTVIVNAPLCTIQGLPSNTELTINGHVRAICQPGDTSIGLDFIRTVVTECQTLSSLPYSTSFEDTDKGRGTYPLPACWSRYNDSSSGNAYFPYNYNYSAKARTGSKLLFFICTNASNNPANELAILPEIDTLVYPIDTLRLKFYAIKSAESQPDANLLVGVMTDPADVTTFTLVDSVLIDDAAYKEYVVDFNSYTGHGAYIAFRFLRPAVSTNFMIDDVLLEVKPECTDFYSNVAVSNISYNSARLTPQDTTAAAGWSYAYGRADADFATYTVVDTFGQSVVLTGLESAVAYRVYIRRVCDIDRGTWMEPVEFVTSYTPATMPYLCGFEDATENRLWEYSHGNYATVNRFCIGSATDAVYEGSNAMYVSSSSGTNYTYNLGAGGDNYAFRKMLFDAKGYQVQFRWKCTGGQTTWDFGRVMIVPDSVPISFTSQGMGVNTPYPANAIFIDPEGKSFMNLTTGDASGWNTISYFLDMTERPGLYNFALLWTSNTITGTQAPLSIDDISITELSCIPPTRVNVSNITTTSATLRYTQPSVAEWQVMVDTFFFATTTIDSVTLTNLEPNHEYSYSVRTICAAGDTSAWRAIDYFRTPCDVFTIPYSEDFERQLSDKCWSMNNATGTSSVVSRSVSQRHGGAAALQVNAAMAVTPELVVDSMHKYILNGWVYSTTDSAYFAVGVMTDPTDVSTYTPTTNLMVQRKNTWTPFTALFTSLLDDENEDFRLAKHVTLAGGSNNLFFDDLSIEPLPSCINPTDVFITNVTAHTFDISFSDNANATQWIVKFNDETALITSNPATVTGLEPSKRYEVYVAALCSATDTSAFSYAGSIFTQCDVIDLPWSTSFEPTEDFAGSQWCNGDLERHCWTLYNADKGMPRYQMTATGVHVHSGTYALYTFTNTNAHVDKLYMILPEFSHPSNMLDINFWYKNGGITPAHTQLLVGYLTNVADTNTFVVLDSLAHYGSYTEYTINTSLYPQIPATARIALVADRNQATAAIYIDDISVDPVLNCSPLSSVDVRYVTDTSACVTFVDTCAQHTAWQYIIGTHGFNRSRVTPVNVTTKSFSLSALRSGTDYDLYVRAYCGPNDSSAWLKAEFSTLCPAVVVTPTSPYYDSFEDLYHNEELGGCYRLEGYNGSYTMRGRTDVHRTGDVGLQAWADTASAPRGLIAYRNFHFEAGSAYRVSIQTRALSSLFNAALYYGKVQDIDSMSLISLLNVPACSSATVSTGVDQCWREIGGYVVVPETGDYFVAIRASINTPTNVIALYFDDFEVRALDGCLPTIVTIDSVGTNFVTCSLDDTVSTHNYEYVLIEGLDTINAPTPCGGSTFTIPNLQSSTGYLLSVRQNCGAGLYSPWISASFSTLCGIRTLFPVTESFENSFPPACWTQLSHSEEDAADASWTTTTVHTRVNSGTYAAVVNVADSGARVALISNAYQFNSPTGYILSLYMYRESSTFTRLDDALHILYSSDVVDIDNISDLPELGVINTCYMLEPVEESIGLYRYEYHIPASLTGVYYLVFDFHSGKNRPVAIDDVTIVEAPTCVAPMTRPVVGNYTMSTADITIDLDGHSSAQFAVSLASAPTRTLGSTIMTQETTIISNLNPSTHYAVRYRYICAPGDTSAWSGLTYFTTTPTNCFAPVNLHTTGILNDHHAEVAWGPAPDAAGYDYELLLGGIVIASASTTTSSAIFDNLTMNTLYTFRVRTRCSGDTTDWRNLSFTTTYPAYNIPYICGFEDLYQNSGWHLTDNGSNPLVIGTDAAAVHTGSRALYVNGDLQSYSYTPDYSFSSAQVALNVPAGHYLVNYDWKIDGDSLYSYGRLFLVPQDKDIHNMNFVTRGGNLPSGSVSLDNDSHLSGSPAWSHYNKIIQVTSSQVYNLAVVFANNMSTIAEPGLSVDNLSIIPVTCLPVDDVEIISVNSNDARIVVTRRDSTTAVQYGISRHATADSVDQWTLVNTISALDTITISGLYPDLDYTIFVRHHCTTADQSPVVSLSLHTPASAVAIPYVCSFEPTDDLTSWILTTGGATNAFTFGNAVCSQGSNSLYISDNGLSYNYNTTSASRSYAFVPVSFAVGLYSITYDWQSKGERNADYARLFLAPASRYPVGNRPISGVSASSLPSGYIALDGGTQLSSSDTWSSRLAEFTIANAGTYNLIVSWTNDNGGGSQPPMALDNIRIAPITCPRINAASVTTDSLSTDMIRLNVAGNNTGAGLYCEVFSDNACTTLVTTSSAAPGSDRITVSGLAASTWYFFRLYSVCQGNDTSFATTVTFRTACGVNATFPYIEGFEDYAHGQTERTQLDDNCWLTSSSNPLAYHYMIYAPSGSPVSSSDGDYINTGDQALCIYNGVATSNTQILALPRVDTLDGKTLSFYYRNTPAKAGINNLYVGYLSNPDSTSSFVQTAAVAFSTFMTQFSHTYTSIPAGARPAIKAVGNDNVYIDDIRINRIIDGGTFYDTICFDTPYNDHGFNRPIGTLVPGLNTLTRTVVSTTPGVADSLYTANVFMLSEIAVVSWDTVCRYQPYVNAIFNIPNPISRSYTSTGTSVTGCDSMVVLNLTVRDTYYNLFDTICQGDAYSFFGQSLTTTGDYFHVDTNRYGCTDTTILHLHVVDTALYLTHTICAGQSYYFEGRNLSQPGIYTVTTQGLHGCRFSKILTLTVLAADSTINVSFCQGGSIQVIDTTITTAGHYTLTRSNPIGCYTTYHITATTTPPLAGHAYDYACEGSLYSGYGITNLAVTSDTTVTFTTRTIDAHCDSVANVHITYVRTVYTDVHAAIVQGNSYTWNDNTYTTPGDYVHTTHSLVTGCDSVVTLHLTYKGAAVDNVADVALTIVPNPVDPGSSVLVYGNYGDIERVDIVNGLGEIVDSFVPSTYPVEVRGITASGLYYVRLTTADGRVYIDKLIVR